MNTSTLIAFIGGGNMATAIIGGLLRQGRAPDSILVVDPSEAQRERLAAQGLRTQAAPDVTLADASLVVWAVKPQQFKEAAQSCAAHTAGALHYSVMAGLRTDDMARWLGTPRIVRAMPNTPALVGQGMTGLFARAEVSPGERAEIEALVAPTGQSLWVEAEPQLDAVTALSGSGPAYVFYFIEAMMQAASDMGLSPAQGRTLALATFGGATALASQSEDSPATLREKVTSKGGTTYAALSHMEAAGVKAAFVQAMRAAEHRAGELGDEFGR
ncbi:MAG TPA: pyrroline-5-carboxylate reductase [Aquabacterium sp.]|uniref:pyrroline-5-carboxylate reductase n=1 Tax=Aquabacterium sp. TaxID=1872578 RepID=UPI002E2F6A7F|nr:pyrroline-5-carboxylate reductase [Aquabacterium sp.]HEX5371517.1 pyrroline-5-carboxylate reductase [Aquabacterium sp.]